MQQQQIINGVPKPEWCSCGKYKAFAFDYSPAAQGGQTWYCYNCIGRDFDDEDEGKGSGVTDDANGFPAPWYGDSDRLPRWNRGICKVCKRSANDHDALAQGPDDQMQYCAQLKEPRKLCAGCGLELRKRDWSPVQWGLVSGGVCKRCERPPRPDRRASVVGYEKYDDGQGRSAHVVRRAQHLQTPPSAAALPQNVPAQCPGPLFCAAAAAAAGGGGGGGGGEVCAFCQYQKTLRGGRRRKTRRRRRKRRKTLRRRRRRRKKSHRRKRRRR